METKNDKPILEENKPASVYSSEVKFSEEGSKEGAKQSGTFWTSANIGGLVFVALLIVFNLIIYSGALDNLGKGESSSGPGIQQSNHPGIPEPLTGVPEPPPPGQVRTSSMNFANGQADGHFIYREEGQGIPERRPNPPPPPPIKAPVAATPRQVYGTQLVSGFIYFSRCQDPKLHLTDKQLDRGHKILSELVQTFPKVNNLLTKCVSCFTPEQIEWARAHRGEPNLVGYKVKDKAGYQPVVSCALEILQKKAKAEEKLTPYVHKAIDFQVQDVANMIVKLESVSDLSLTPSQAEAILPLLRQLADLDKKRENKLRQDLGNILSITQMEWLGENMDTVRLDYHNILILYALEVMNSGRTADKKKEK